MTNPAPKATPSSVAQSTTPNEIQDLQDGFILKTIKKFDNTHLYNLYFPDGDQAFFNIFGPSDGRMSFDHKGNIRIKAGAKTKERGPGSGRIWVSGNALLCRQRGKGTFSFQHEEGDPKKEGLSISCTGNFTEESAGQHTINAKTILIQASDITIKAGSNLTLQAGEAGGGTITLAAGSIATKAVNKSEEVTGRVETIGSAEKTDVQYDPRASVNLISTGAVNNKIVGDESITVTGISHKTVVGGAGQLIKDRTAAIKLEAAAGNIDIKTPAIVNVKGATIFLN